MRLRQLALVLLALFVVATCAIAAQRAPQGAGRGRAKMRIARLAKALNLSDAQKTQIKAIIKDARVSAKAIKANTSLTPEARRDQLKALRQQTKQKIKALLTPDQIEKLKQIRARRHKKA